MLVSDVWSLLLCSMMNAFSEGLELADRSGLNPQTLLDVLVRQLTADSSHIPLVLHLLFHFFLIN